MKQSQINPGKDKVFLTKDELSEEMQDAIQEFINDEILNFEDSCSSEEEAEALEYFACTLRVSEDYRVYKDGSIQVVMNPNQGSDEANEEFLSFEWEDEDGDKQKGCIINYFRGNVELQFDDEATSGGTSLEGKLKSKVIALF